MRDGTVLRADVYRPKSSGPVPVILMRTQYGKDGAQVQPARYQTPDWFASHCYLVVVQDIRGQGSSGGTFNEFTHDGDDGYDSVEWAATLPGSNGKVGMYGSSYVGATQWLAATSTPPHLVTIVPANTASDYYDGWMYEGGEFRLAFVLPWAIGLAGSAATNRHDDTTASALKSAGEDPTRWLASRPYASPAGTTAGQSRSRAMVFRLDHPFVARRLLAAVEHPRPLPVGAGARARLRGMVRRVPRRRYRELHRNDRCGRHSGGTGKPATRHRPLGPPGLGPARFAAGATAQRHRNRRRQPDQRAHAGLVRPLPQGRRQRRVRHPAGGLLPDGRQHLALGDELATAPDPLDSLLPVR